MSAQRSEKDKQILDELEDLQNLKNDTWRFRLAWLLQRFVLAPSFFSYTHLLNQTKIHGKEHLQTLKGQSFLVCMNHTSSWDIWAGFEVAFASLSHFFQTDYYFCGLGAKERLGKKLIRDFTLSAGVLPVDRRKGIEQYALQEVVRLEKEKKKKLVCLVYPEGTRSQDGFLAREYKAGIGWLQVMTGLPVLPAYQTGYNQLPGFGKHLDIHLSEPIEPAKNLKPGPAGWIEQAKIVMNRLIDMENLLNPSPSFLAEQTKKNLLSPDDLQVTQPKNIPLHKCFALCPDKASHSEGGFANELANCGGMNWQVNPLRLQSESEEKPDAQKREVLGKNHKTYGYIADCFELSQLNLHEFKFPLILDLSFFGEDSILDALKRLQSMPDLEWGVLIHKNPHLPDFHLKVMEILKNSGVYRILVSGFYSPLQELPPLDTLLNKFPKRPLLSFVSSRIETIEEVASHPHNLKVDEILFDGQTIFGKELQNPASMAIYLQTLLSSHLDQSIRIGVMGICDPSLIFAMQSFGIDLFFLKSISIAAKDSHLCKELQEMTLHSTPHQWKLSPDPAGFAFGLRTRILDVKNRSLFVMNRIEKFYEAPYDTAFAARELKFLEDVLAMNPANLMKVAKDYGMNPEEILKNPILGTILAMRFYYVRGRQFAMNEFTNGGDWIIQDAHELPFFLSWWKKKFSESTTNLYLGEILERFKNLQP